MSEEMEAVARRAVACPGWRWMPGTADTRGGRVVERLTHAGCVKLDRSSIRYAGPNGGASWHAEDDFTNNGPSGMLALLPDLTDPATLGCLLALVREAWRDGCIHVAWCRLTPQMPWMVWGQRESHISVGPTEAAALIDALEAAPAKVAP